MNSFAIIEKINQQIADKLYHGASVAIYQQGGWQEYYLGTADGERPITPGLTYDLASVSKVVGVATVVIQLLVDGVLQLDVPLQTYYPDFADSMVTIRQLLTHSTGIDPFIPNRDDLSATELIVAINQITVTTNKSFLYTDINFLLLGFMLEQLLSKSLPQIFSEQVFQPLGMKQTGFGPCPKAVPTISGRVDGQVHDPKARVLGIHSGSAGLFSTLDDLKIFCQHYLERDFGIELTRNYSKSNKPRSLGWNLEGEWLDHTGYTGPLIMVNRIKQEAFIFLTNRTFEYDNRPIWIEKRGELMDIVRRE